MRTAISILCAAMLAACAVHHPPGDHASLFQAETDRVRVEFGFPGITAACVMKDGTVVTATSGLADVEANVPMTDNTRMLSASIGKSFVGALCISLAIEGRLSLDEPISRWIDTFDWFPLDFWTPPSPITVTWTGWPRDICARTISSGSL